jgi:hypothetical protein
MADSRLYGVIGSLAALAAVGADLALQYTSYPRSLAWFNPLLFLILFGLLGSVVPALRYVVLPAGINLALFLFFVISTLFRGCINKLLHLSRCLLHFMTFHHQPHECLSHRRKTCPLMTWVCALHHSVFCLQ